MPLQTFTHDSTFSGTSLDAMIVGESLGTGVTIVLHREVSLAWDVTVGSSSEYFGVAGDSCYKVTATEYILIWSAQISETVEKTSKPTPGINNAADTVGDIGKGITGLGGAALIWSWLGGPITVAAAGGVTVVGGVITAIGDGVEWLTEEKVETWTTNYQESGKETFTNTTYEQIECVGDMDYVDIELPDPPSTLELETSKAVTSVGTDLGQSGNLHPPD